MLRVDAIAIVAVVAVVVAPATGAVARALLRYIIVVV